MPISVAHRLVAVRNVARKIVAYVLSLRWAGDCAAVWDFVSLPLIAAVVLFLLFNIQALAIVALAALLLLFLGVGLAAHSPLDRPDGVVEAAMERWIAARREAAVAKRCR